MNKIFFCTLLLLICPAIYGQDNQFNRTERIIHFHSDITIDTAGMIRVAETIRVFANGVDIKRGIVRSIPVYRMDTCEKKKRMPFDVISVSCNGNKENYKIKNAGDYKEIFIGNADVILEPGVYEYLIVYKSAGQIGFFDDFDELYWNVTGNEWEFRIEQASATITLPNGVRSISTSCYTGVLNATEMNCSSEAQGNKVYFKTDALLAEKEGFTVAVSFPRGIVRRPPPPTQLELFWGKYKYHICASICLTIFCIFFYFTWRKVGKDPEKPVVIPTFKPPHDRSPAVTRYLYKRKYDNKTFTAALVSMAVKKAIRISDKDKKFTLEPIERNENLSKEEKQIYDVLFPDNKSIAVTDKNYAKFEKANSNLIKSLQANWALKDYFLKNLKYIVLGTVLTMTLIISFVLITVEDLEPWGIFLFTLPFLSIPVIIITQIGQIIKSKNCLVKFIALIFLAIFGTVFLFLTIWMLGLAVMSLKNSWIIGCFLLAMLFLYGLYVYLIKAPTKLGAQTFSEIEGFKMYLKTAEEYRLNLLTPPERTPELFEKLLPYAIALGVENEWGKKFTDVLRKANYAPDWYNSNKPFTPAVFPATFARSFTSSVGSARINPTASSSSGGSWSSGSGGGGRSGGGGGGGGGRGW